MPPEAGAGVEAAAGIGGDRGPIGILACGGALPLELARAAGRLGRGPHIVGIEGFAAPQIADFSHDWVNLGQVGRMLDSLRRAGCRDLVIAGAMRRPDLWRLRIDHGFFRAIGTVLRLTRGGDDSVLRRVVAFFEAEGFTVLGVRDVAPHLLAPAGALGHIAPSPVLADAILRAARLVHALGPFDVGQGVVATAAAVVAIEGARGTDAMLEALAEGGAGGGRESAKGGVLVKLAKPGQELRVDLPTIGPRTVDRVVAAGLAGIAVGEGQSLVLEREQVAKRADAEGLFVVGIDPPAERLAPVSAEADGEALMPRGRRTPGMADRRDIAIGRRLLAILGAERAGRAAVIAGEHVLAIDASFPIAGMLAGLGERNHWGLRVLQRRIGVLIVDGGSAPPGEDAGAILLAAKAAGLAGIAVLGWLPMPWREPAVVTLADAAGLFLVAREGDAA